MEELLDHTTMMDSGNTNVYTNWLTAYAAHYRYVSKTKTLARWEMEGIRMRVNDAAQELIDKAHRLSNTSDEELSIEGTPWEIEIP